VYSSKLTPVGPVYQRELIVPAVGQRLSTRD
jgi:hypothetical protein